MGGEGPIETHWEVLGADRNPSGIVPYRPAPHDSSDGIAFHGEAKVVGSRDWTRLATGVYGAVAVDEGQDVEGGVLTFHKETSWGLIQTRSPTPT